MILEEAKAKANEAMDLLLKIGSKMMEENEKIYPGKQNS